MAFVPDHRIATLIAGLATLLLGAVVVGMAPRHRLHRAAGLFFLLRGGFFTLVAFSSPADDLQGRLAVYALVAIPFSGLWLGHRLRQDCSADAQGFLGRPWPLVLLGTLGILELAYLIDHGLFFGSTWGGPLAIFDDLQFVAYIGVSIAAFMRYLKTRDSTLRRALYALMIAFLAEPLFFSTHFVATQGVFPDIDMAASTLLVTAGVVLAVGAWFGVWWVQGHDHAEDRHDFYRAATLAGAAVVTGILVPLNARFAFAPAHVLDLPEVNAFWTLWTVIVTAYAILRYRLFTMDLRVKQFLRLGTAAALVGTVFIVISEGLENLVDVGGVVESTLVAIAISAALYPAYRIARRLAESWMPGVAPTDAYRQRRRQEIYRAAFERAYLDGSIDPHELAVLQDLATGLGLGEREAQRIKDAASRSSTAA